MTEVQHPVEWRRAERQTTIAPTVGRIAAVLFFISLMLLCLYGLGTAQRFLDATLMWLLSVLEVLLVLTAVFALCSCCLYAVHTIAGRWRFAALPTLLSLLGTMVAIALLASLRMVATVITSSPPPSILIF